MGQRLPDRVLKLSDCHVVTARIVMSGRTAAGKTTHAALLASAYDLPMYSASGFFVSQMRESPDASPSGARWSPAMDEMRANDSAVDDQLDDYMVSALNDVGGGVFDGCMLPWLHQPEGCINVWIESGLPCRVRKCIVSRPTFRSFSEFEAERIVSDKDAFTALRLRNARGAEFRPDPRLFDLVVSNDSLLPLPTRECADRGIAAFHPVLVAAISYLTGERPDEPKHPWIQQLGRRL